MINHAEHQLDIEDLLKEPEGDYSAHALAHKYRLSLGQAVALIKVHGPSRTKLDAILAPQRYP
ncbi:hypothetical protein [Aminobacter carboxidus]|uniref:Uncharacterized protein n=1 Tax=Aminobacter carboxidus TaxID=376165 RepID=A0ABR9GR95_9HYPH|nr:hypothetical protein [Aminobacter carboxidus]MBE1206163.1 hypothetical protein [Aminobacter carboxidus]